MHELGQSHNNSQIEVEHLLIAETSKSITAENEERIYQEMRSGVLDLLRNSLRPEFLNRIDERIVFRSLSLENIKDIVDLQFKELAHKMAEELLFLKISEEIIWRLPRRVIIFVKIQSEKEVYQR